MGCVLEVEKVRLGYRANGSLENIGCRTFAKKMSMIMIPYMEAFFFFQRILGHVWALSWDKRFSSYAFDGLKAA